MNKTRTIITMQELETIMTLRTGEFDADSVDTYGFSINMLCTGVHFDKAMNDNTKYICMILICKCGEIQIDPITIVEIYLDLDGIITFEFNNGLPDLQIRYR